MTLLTLDNVHLRFAEKMDYTLQSIQYTIQKGDFVILLGSNGSGKSTLLKLLYRQYQPQIGHIHFMEKPLNHYSHLAFSENIAVLTQHCDDALFASLTVYENYLLVKKLKAKMKLSSTKTERLYLQNYLMDFNPNLAKHTDTLVSQLSGGEKQALALALCLFKPPKLLLLDEHTSALDPKTSLHIMQLTDRFIQQHHITCVLTTHDLDLSLRYGNRILMLREGKIHKTYEAQNKQNLAKATLMRCYY